MSVGVLRFETALSGEVRRHSGRRLRVRVGDSRIRKLAPLEGLDDLTVAGRDDLEPPSSGKVGARRLGRIEVDHAGQ